MHNIFRSITAVSATAMLAFLLLSTLQSAAANESTAPEAATVTVAHFAPFADTAAGTSVTVRVNGTDVITGFEFGNVASDLSLPAGAYLLEILPTGASTVAISASVTLSDGVDYTVAAIGNGSGQPLELLPLIDDNMSPANATNAKIRIAHLAPFADTLAGTQVNICTEAGAAIASNVPYKTITEPYLALPAGEYDLKIVPAADGCGTAVLDIPPINLAAGSVTDVFAIGDITNQPLQAASTSGLDVVTAPAALEESDELMLDKFYFLPVVQLQ